MQPALIEELIERYPEVYGELLEADCGDGWFAILDALGEALASCGEAGNRRPPQVLSCKQKCGRLAFGKLHLERRYWYAFDIATEMSLRICERCGVVLAGARCVCSA